MKKPSKHGITFIEVLITISIIGILSAITAISFANSQKKAKDEAKINDLQRIKKLWKSIGQTIVITYIPPHLLPSLQPAAVLLQSEV